MPNTVVRLGQVLDPAAQERPGPDQEPLLTRAGVSPRVRGAGDGAAWRQLAARPRPAALRPDTKINTRTYSVTAEAFNFGSVGQRPK